MKPNKILRWLCSGILTGLSVWGWVYTRPEPITEWTFVNVFSLILFGALFLAIYFFALPLIDGRSLRYSAPIGLFFGLCTACGAEIFRNDSLDYSLTGVAQKVWFTICIGMVSTAAVILILRRLPEFVAAKKGYQLSPSAVFFISWGVMLVCWLPCYIAFFPGIFAYDIPTQLAGISQGDLSADHPLLHTIIAWICIVIGNAIHSYTIGAAIYSLLQMLALSASFAACVAYLQRKGVSLVWQALSLAWFAFLPMHPLFAINATKDVLFAACTVMFLLITAELLSRPKECLRSIPFWICYTLSVIIMALMRNTGIYVFFVFIPILMVLLPRRRLLALALGVLCVVSFYGTQTALNLALDVKDGRFTETLSVPLQQVARCAYDGVLSEKDLAEVERYIPKEVWKQYSSRLADPVKNNMAQGDLVEDPVGFVRLWCKLAVRHPASYIDAFLGLNIGFWYPDMQYPDTRTWHDYIETGIKPVSEEIVIYDQDLWPAARSFYKTIAKKTDFESIPLISLLFKPGIYFWLTLCLLGASLFYRKRTAGGVLAFLILSWLLQLLSPIALVRYAYPLMVSVPLLGGCFAEKNENIIEKKR